MLDHQAALAEAHTVHERGKRMALEDAIHAYVGLRGLDSEPKPDPDPDPDPPSSDFLVFEDINYRGRPNLQSEFGMISLKIHYESAFFDDRHRAGDGDFKLPTTNRIVDAARSSPKYSCIDIERWWSHSDNDLDGRAASAYEHVAEIYDDALDPGDRFGFYSTIPIRSLNKISGSKRADWQRTNDRLKGLGEIVDMVFPSLYTLVDDTSTWEPYALANIAEAEAHRTRQALLSVPMAGLSSERQGQQRQAYRS